MQSIVAGRSDAPQNRDRIPGSIWYGPGSAVHRFALRAHAAPRPGHKRQRRMTIADPPSLFGRRMMRVADAPVLRGPGRCGAALQIAGRLPVAFSASPALLTAANAATTPPVDPATATQSMQIWVRLDSDKSGVPNVTVQVTVKGGFDETVVTGRDGKVPVGFAKSGTTPVPGSNCDPWRHLRSSPAPRPAPRRAGLRVPTRHHCNSGGRHEVIVHLHDHAVLAVIVAKLVPPFA